MLTSFDEGKFSVVFILTLILIFPLSVLFSSYDENDGYDYYKTDVTIQTNDDGSISVVEEYNIRFEDSSGETYITKPLDLDIDKNSIKVYIDGNETVWVSYQEGVQSTYGDTEPYVFSYRDYDDGNGTEFEINAFYKRQSGMEHKIRFEYVVLNVIDGYADCAELYYKVYTSFSQALNNLTVTVKAPAGEEFNADNTNIFGHGDPNGVASFSSDGSVVFTSSRLSDHTMFEIRVVSKGVFTLVTDNVDRYDLIMNEESRFYKETIDARNAEMIQMIAIPIIIAIFVSFFFVRRHMGKKPSVVRKENNSIPDVKPNITARFRNSRNILPSKERYLGNSLTATILDLALQGFIAIEENKNKDLVFKALKKDMVEYKYDNVLNMTGFEKIVFDLIFIHAAKGKDEITLTQLKNEFNRHPPNAVIKNAMTEDDKEFSERKYIEDRKKKFTFEQHSPIVIASAFTAFELVLAVIYGSFLFPIIGTLVAIIFALSLSYVMVPIHLTDAGIEEFESSQALKDFYTNSLYYKNRQAIELSFWEQHLVYATALGVAKKVIKELELRLTQIDTPAARERLIFLNNLSQVHGGLSKGFSSINTAASRVSYNPSSGGGGGGFSGGGGGGHGGGGGGSR